MRMQEPRLVVPGQWGAPAHRRLPRSCERNSVLPALRDGSARQANLGEYGRIVAQGLVHVGDHLHDLAEQRALAIVYHLGDEVGADRLPVGIKLDLAVGSVELDLGKRVLELGLVVAEIAIDLAKLKDA